MHLLILGLTVGLWIEHVKRLKELELENNRLRKAISDLTLDKRSCRKLHGEATKSRASFACIRACASAFACFRAPRLCGARAAPLDAAQGPIGP